MARYSVDVLDVAVLLFSLALAGLAIYLIARFRRAILDEIERAKTVVKEENENLLSKIADSLSPRIIHCASESDVAREAKTMIEKAIAHRSAMNLDVTEKHSEEDESANVIEPAFVTFYGAADLSIPITPGLPSEEKSHFSDFSKALAQAVEMGVRVRRHINLFTPPELEKRTEAAQSHYLRWLITRFNFVVANPSFELIDNPRVPQWGASFSSLLTAEGVLEIKANGLSGIAIYHANISRNVRESLRRARKMADVDRVRSIRASESKSVDWFFEYILDVSKIGELDINATEDDGTLRFYQKGSYFDQHLQRYCQKLVSS